MRSKDGRAVRLSLDLTLADDGGASGTLGPPVAEDAGSAPDLPRVLAFAGRGRALPLAEHAARGGSLDDATGGTLIEAVAAAGLRGRGGAAFPRPEAGPSRPSAGVGWSSSTAPRASRSAPRTRAAELAPHLVIDGAVLAAEAVGRARGGVAVKRYAPWAAHAAVAGRWRTTRHGARVRRREPGAYLAGEESALHRAASTAARRSRRVTPPRPPSAASGGGRRSSRTSRRSRTWRSSPATARRGSAGSARPTTRAPRSSRSAARSRGRACTRSPSARRR